MHEHDNQDDTPIVTQYTNVSECVDYIVPFILRDHVVLVHLDQATTDKGIVITDMPNFRFHIEIDIDDKDKRTLNLLEFRDGKDYASINISKLFGWVTSFNEGLGTLTSINLTVTVYPCKSPFDVHRSPYLEKGGEYELQPFLF